MHSIIETEVVGATSFWVTVWRIWSDGTREKLGTVAIDYRDGLKVLGFNAEDEAVVNEVIV